MKYYVVWQGRVPGIYTDIQDALDQVDDFPGASFKSFTSAEAAAAAFRSGSRAESRELGALLTNARQSDGDTSRQSKSDYMSFPEIDLNGWAVDAACAGNPGRMEYRGVDLMSGQEIFRVGPFEESTNNIGEFLAIVHALSLMFQKGEKHTIYSDSVTGMSWVRNRKVKTKLPRNAKTEKSYQLMERALSWLNTHSVDVKIRKWDTDKWGEIPADFGRK